MNGWGRRRRYVYAYDVRDLRTYGQPVVGYVGKTSSHPSYRDRQHRDEKLWARQIVGPQRIVWAGDCGRIALWVREVYYIRRMKPLFNVEHNRRNPHRIQPWRVRDLYGRL